MRVVLFPSSVDLVGVSTHVLNLATLLNEVGLLDVVVCPADGWLPKTLDERRIPHEIVTLSYRPAAFIASSSSLLRFLQSRRSADIVHLHGRFPLFVSALARVTGSRLRFVATVHQFAHPHSRGRWAWKRGLETRLLRQMNRICCVSEDLKEEVLARMGAAYRHRVDVIPNWIEPLWHGATGAERGAPPERNAGSPIRICGIGRLSPEKGFDLLVQALAILKRRGYAASCDIFGDGPEEPALRKLADEAGVLERVRLEAPSPDVRRRLPTYDLLVVPSRSESFGIVALEAYDASVPVIASDVAGLRTTVLHEKTGLLFETGSSTSLAGAIETLMQSPSLAKGVVANARNYLRRHLPNDELRAQYRAFYAKALSDGEASTRPGGTRMAD